MSKRAEQGRATREQLIDAATPLFAEHGYEDTSIEAVLDVTGVSRGALYHHFAGKDALFAAVFEAVETQVLDRIAQQVAGSTDPVAVLRAVALAWIDVAGDPVVQRVILIDAPAVLGWQRWREMGERNSIDSLRLLLQEVSDAGHLAPGLVNAFAHMLLAALDEIALMIAESGDPDAAMAEGRTAVEELLRRLLTP